MSACVGIVHAFKVDPSLQVFVDGQLDHNEAENHLNFDSPSLVPLLITSICVRFLLYLNQSPLTAQAIFASLYRVSHDYHSVLGGGGHNTAISRRTIGFAFKFMIANKHRASYPFTRSGGGGSTYL